MKIDFDMLDKLVLAGATAQVIVEFLRGAEMKKAPKRARDRKRQKAIHERDEARKGEIERDQAISPPIAETPSQIAERELYARGKQLCGKSAGGLVSSLLRHHGYDIGAARKVVEVASTKSDPREYLSASMRTTANGKHGPSLMETFDELIAGAKGGDVEGSLDLRDVTPRGS